MRKKDVDMLAAGLYRLMWKDGSSSLASVGTDEHGDRWYAPTNWISVPGNDWSMVASADRIITMRYA